MSERVVDRLRDIIDLQTKALLAVLDCGYVEMAWSIADDALTAAGYQTQEGRDAKRKELGL